MEILTIVLCAIIVGALVALARRFLAYEMLAPNLSPIHDAPTLAIVVPARNEAANIERCLAGLLAQAYPLQQLSILIVDDNSEDGTAGLVQCVADIDSSVRLIPAGPLPGGWIGKPHACWRGARNAGNCEWLCFMDADTSASPALLSTAVAFARSNRIDMLSLQPFQELGSFWERLIIPVGFLVVGMTTDLRRVNNPAMPEAAANGQFILIRREAYEAVGGHAAVRATILEDMALARRLKQKGYRLRLMGGENLIRARMYTNLRAIWEGLSKNAALLIGRSATAATFNAVAMLLLGWIPVILPIWAWADYISRPSALNSVVLSLALTCATLTFVAYIVIARFFRIPVWYGLVFPLGLTLTTMIAFNGLRRHIRGYTSWKGRVYS